MGCWYLSFRLQAWEDAERTLSLLVRSDGGGNVVGDVVVKVMWLVIWLVVMVVGDVVGVVVGSDVVGGGRCS